MRTRLFLIATLGLALLLVASPAQAIVYGEPDGNGHPNVGAILADYDDDNPGLEQLCSGTLIDEDVFLTAAHCTAYLESLGIPNNQIWVSFDQDVDPVTSRTRLIRGTWVTNPWYDQAQSDPGDLAVIRLSKAVRVAPARLPALGLLIG